MVAYYKNNESKSLFVSFLAHTVLMGGYFLVLHQNSLNLMQSSKMVVMEMSTFERSPSAQPIQPTPPSAPIEEVKNVEPIKPLEYVKPKHKHRMREKPLVNPLPIHEAVVPQIPSEPSNIMPTVQEPTPIATSAQSVQAEPLVKTDFEMIRDKVLSQLLYPSIAKRMHWNGVVHIALQIDTSGYLQSATIHQSSGREILDNAALDAANKLKGQQLPKPQSKSTVILPIAFKLR